MTALPPWHHPSDAAGKRTLLTAAIRLMGQYGVHGTSIRQLADVSGLSNPALFKHFPNKEALVLELFRRCYLALHDQLRQILQQSQPPQDTLRQLLQCFSHWLQHYPDALLYLNEHFISLWAQLSPEDQARSALPLLHAWLEQRPLPGSVSLRAAILVGTLGQLARLRFYRIEVPTDAESLYAQLAPILLGETCT
ncbi:TetR/AcrR family transcriptional regulator [Leeia aquatica]|uniref:TetR/AcrR family transcriptional regulator n=1 Tax=Leeia aquatica TaxID=2725557 RepID=A0A847S7D5_9NEIS|nr:TetR/AcrR family transcriptional regulator [Leeia aquatica]NLR74937.1 TetR/AcrR family transcriptional regulator [Leeia aquatica]